MGSDVVPNLLRHFLDLRARCPADCLGVEFVEPYGHGGHQSQKVLQLLEREAGNPGIGPHLRRREGFPIGFEAREQVWGRDGVGLIANDKGGARPRALMLALNEDNFVPAYPVSGPWPDGRTMVIEAQVRDEIDQIEKAAAAQYPLAAARNQTSGYAVVEFTVTSSGAVTSAHVIDAQPRRVFDEAAIRAVEQSTYKPALKDGEPVSAVLQRRVDFKFGG